MHFLLQKEVTKNPMIRYNFSRQTLQKERSLINSNKMIRRKPTAITLTTEDVAMYEDARAREALECEKAAALQARQDRTPQQKNQNRDPNDELRPLPGDRARGEQVKNREERIGLGGGSSRG
jgi:hypothetical protein